MQYEENKEDDSKNNTKKRINASHEDCKKSGRLDEMSGSGRRRHSKWDLKEDISPENQNENARSNKDRSSFNEHESRDHMSGTRDVQRAEGMKKESIAGLEGGGHYATRKSTGPDGGRQQSRTHSPRSRGRSFSRSRSKSRSRSPARNPRHQPGLNDQSGKSGHSALLCRDFAAGRCRNGDHCHFVHHSSSRKHLNERIGSDRENMHRDDDALKSHSDTHSTGRRSTNICNDFLKGKCRRGASCKYSHHNPVSDESGKGTVDGSYQDGHSYHHNKHAYTETKSPDETRLKHHLNGIHEVLGDGKWGDKALPKAHGMISNSSSNMDLCVSSDIPPVQGTYRLDESFSASPIISVNGVQQSQPTFFSNPMGEGMQMPYHQATIETKPGDGKSQMAFPLHQTEREDMQKLHHQSMVDSILDDGAYMANVDVSQAAPGPPTPSESGVLNGQLSQIPPHFSATLAHLFEKRDQLPQLYAAANPQRAAVDGGSDLANSLASVIPVSESASLLNQATESRRQSDPIWDSIETKMASTDIELLSSSIEQRSSVPGTLVTPSSSAIPASLVAGETTASDLLEVCFSGDDVLGHQSLDLNQRGPVNNENEGATGRGANEAQEQGSAEDMAVIDNVNDDKKAKDVKEMRPFKFALAEFVKELLKPTWKEGKMSKEVHKTIVKKVVDKVSDSIQEAHIPRTKEKIDQYLSFSKPKLSKLVQAYLERYKKP